MGIRPCRDEEQEVILAIINTAAAAYRGVIPPDRWQEPYMESSELEHETGAGVRFWGFAADGELIGVMGIQPLRDLDLIRHAYVLPDHQRRGVGAALLRHLRGMSSRRTLVGTWEAAEWAIRFYRRHGFELVPPEQQNRLGYRTTMATCPNHDDTLAHAACLTSSSPAWNLIARSTSGA